MHPVVAVVVGGVVVLAMVAVVAAQGSVANARSYDAKLRAETAWRPPPAAAIAAPAPRIAHGFQAAHGRSSTSLLSESVTTSRFPGAAATRRACVMNSGFFAMISWAFALTHCS